MPLSTAPNSQRLQRSEAVRMPTDGSELLPGPVDAAGFEELAYVFGHGVQPVLFLARAEAP